ncbi:hypothetical protein OBK01_07035 [Empedobacter falsenii]
MKNILTLLLVMLSNVIFAQNLDYKTLKQFIGNRVTELEDYYQIKSSSIDDNFGNQKVHYNSITIDPYTISLEVETEGKNIKRIVVVNSENRTNFFQNIAQEIEQTTPTKKNYKTVYISLVKNSTKKKIYQESISHLIDLMKKPTTNLKENHGLLESSTLNTTISIDDTASVLIVN